MSPLPRSGPWMRSGLILAAVALATTLLGSSWLAYRQFAEAADTLARAEGQALARSMQRLLRTSQGPPEDFHLDGYVAQLGPSLLAASIIAPEGEVLARSAEAPEPLVGTIAPEPIFEKMSDARWRLSMMILDRRPPPLREARPGARPRDRRGRRGPPGRGPGRRGEDRRPPDGREGPLRGPHLELVYQPLLAEAARSSALRSLVVAALGSLGVVLTATLLWNLLREQERSRAQREEEKRLRSLGEMSAVLAHEIRNPLASLKGNAQLLEESLPRDTPQQRKAARLVRESKRLQRLTSDLLQLARSEQLHLSERSVHRLLTEALEIVGLEPVQARCEPADLAWKVDGDRLRQVLVNLLSNAKEAAGEDGVRVAARQTAGSLEVDVEDDGPGIPPDELERIFEPFFTTRTTGTGLGLAVSRRIVELHGGSLTAVSEAPGARFTISLPRMEQDDAQNSDR
ncbi:MAG: ATP-binding protein [Acidobacteriota bacterium]